MHLLCFCQSAAKASFSSKSRKSLEKQDLGLDPKWDSGTWLPYQKKPSEFHIQQPSVKHRESYRSQICILKLVCWALSCLGYPLRNAEYMRLSKFVLTSVLKVLLHLAVYTFGALYVIISKSEERPQHIYFQVQRQW